MMIRRAPLILGSVALLLGAAGGVLAGSGRTAVFAGGCYWSMDHDMKPVPGVTQVTSGFVPDPALGPRGHYEAVRVTYDPSKITYPQLVARYLRMTDPTDSGGQFCDRGPDYRPAIFTSDAGETQAARAAIAAAQPIVKKPIITPVLAFQGFQSAPMDQQDWAHKNFAKYAVYRQGCGKDRIVQAVWGGR